MIKLKNTPEQLELLKALGSKDKTISVPAAEAFAAFIAPVIQKVISQIGTASLIFDDLTYNEDDSPSVPLDLYYDKAVGYMQIWSQTIAGGLATNEVSGGKELKIATYNLNTAVSWLKKYARRGRFDVANAAINKLTQEVLVKQELNAWSVLLAALAQSNTNGADHVIAANTTNVFQVEDVNQLMVLYKRIHKSFAQGTSSAVNGGKLTDLFVSPEIKGQIRAFAWNPMNVRSVPNTDESTALGLPDRIRERIFNAAGEDEIFGVVITELQELGSLSKYNTLFDVYYSGSAPTFTDASDELVIGANLATDNVFVRAVQQIEGGGTFSVVPDNQFVDRQDMVGFYGDLNEGRAVLDSKELVGLVV